MEQTNTIKDWWKSLAPEKRKTVMGLAGLTLLLLLLWSFIKAGPEPTKKTTAEAKPDVAILTGSDTRTLGMEQVGAEIRSLHQSATKNAAQIEAMQQERVTKKDFETMKAQIDALQKALETSKLDGDKRLSEVKEYVDRSRDSNSTAPTPAPTIDPTDATRGGLFDRESSPVNASPRVGGRGTTAAPQLLKVQVLGQAQNVQQEGIEGEGDVYIPAGSILSGVLITGVDAPTGLESKRDPIPALMRVQHDAILPNRFKSDVRECFVLFGATGDLSTERALMRAETLSCIRRDGGVIETQLDAWAMGDDGKAGIRGRLVSRNGSLVAKAAFASFAEALSQIFRPVALQGLNTSPGRTTEFQAPDTAEALEAAGYAGFGGAMRRLSDYFVDLADEIVPFVEVDAARQVEAVLIKGVTLKVRP